MELLSIALPLVVSQACETVMMFVDRLFLSRLGPEYMSAAMGGGLTAFVAMTFFIGLTGYANAMVAQHYGAGQKDRCPTAAAQAVILSILAYPIILCCIPLGGILFRATGIAPEQLVPQEAYFRIVIFGTIFALLRNGFCSFFSGIGRTRVIMVSAAVAMTVNVIANYILIFGKMGAPAMGIRGAAYGTLIGSLSGLLVVVAVYFGAKNRAAYPIIAGFRFDWSMMKKLIRFGSPSGMEFFLNLLAFNVLIMVFHSYGTTVAAATTVAMNWDMVSFIPLIGVNIGVTSLVGRYMGARTPDIAHRATISGFKLACLYSVVIVLVFSLMPRPLVEIFRPAKAGKAFEEAVPLAVYMIRLVSLYVFADAVAIVFSGALRGAGDTVATMCISVGTHWLAVAILIPLIKVAKVEPRTAWAVAVALIWVICLGFYARYRTGRWRKMKVVDQPSDLSGPHEIG